jgi:adenine-specific DNA-methyltransferase
MEETSSVKLGTACFRLGDALEELRACPDQHYRLAISSPPYNLRKPYERDRNMTVSEYRDWQSEIISELSKKITSDGSICWQVGSYVRDGELIPLDMLFFDIFSGLGWKLRNRIIWRFNFGHNSSRRFSGRYETLLWFTQSVNYKFNLDPVRVPQLYPGKRHSKRKHGKAGAPSGNPQGKNPSDYWEFSAAVDFMQNPVWDIPNVKANHPEQSSHPCQFPIELAERCVLAMTEIGDHVIDPFVGTGSSVLAAIKHGRHGLGIDKEEVFVELANSRAEMLSRGELSMRPLGKSVRRPRLGEKVAQVPDEWREKVRG